MKKCITATLWILPLAFILILSFNNCARYGALHGSQDSASVGDSGEGSGSLPPGEELNSEKLGIPIALLSAEQTLSSMMKVTNLSTASASLRTEYNLRYGTLASGNDLSLVNGPLLLSSTSLAGEACNGLLTQEKALADNTRNFFNNINFTTGVNNISDEAFNTAIRGMARSFWGRNENSEELSLLQAYKAEFIQALSVNARTQASSSNNLMLGTCAAILSSLDAISY